MNNILNIALVNPVVTETLPTPQTEFPTTREGEINAIEKRFDLNGCSRKGRQGAFDAFTLCPETDVSSR